MERLRLLDAIAQSDAEASVFTTYSFFAPFYEDVVLRRLNAAGSRHNVVLIDAGQLALSLGDDTTRPRRAGFDYTLLPIASAGSFHPKIALLVSRKAACTLVGSHNLTLSGYGINRELTSFLSFSGDEKDLAGHIARATYRAITEWISQQGAALPKQTREAVRMIQEIAPWLRRPDDNTDTYPCHFSFSSRTSDDLWTQVGGLLTGAVRRIGVTSAFFDSKFAFIEELRTQFPRTPIVVGVDPESVSLPAKPSVRSVRWVNASSLGDQSGYLHAKALWFDSGKDGGLLSIGSANASQPAWLARGPGRNEEAMVTWLGSDARRFAENIGLPQLFDCPLLSAEEIRSAVRRFRTNQTLSSSRTHTTTVLAAIDGEGVHFSQSDLIGLPERIDIADGRHVRRATLTGPRKLEDGWVFALPTPYDGWARHGLLTHSRGESPFLCHHVAEIERIARPGQQVQVRTALLQLQSDNPDLSGLIATIEKVIFSEPDIVVDREVARGITSQARKKTESAKSELKTLEVPDSRDHRHETRRRLLRSGDLAYLLDVLIRELGVGLAPSGPATDRAGRLEEEQAGKDDEEPAPTPKEQLSDQEISEICARKVHKVVRRMLEQLDAAETDPSRGPHAIAQLLAVLALMRALRLLDRQPRWRSQGLTLVPDDERLGLLEGVLDAAFGGNEPLMVRIADEIDETDELSRLRGLLIWLAWDCGIRADERIAFGDDERDRKVWERAALMELLLPAVGDHLCVEEATKSVMAVAPELQLVGAQSWLDRHLAWARRIADLPHEAAVVSNRISAEVGGVAILGTIKNSRPRIVREIGERSVGLFVFGTEDHVKSYSSERVLALTPANR